MVSHNFKDPLRLALDNPRTDDERAYAAQEAELEASRLWDKLSRSPKHRERVIRRLAVELLDTLPKEDSSTDRGSVL